MRNQPLNKHLSQNPSANPTTAASAHGLVDSGAEGFESLDQCADAIQPAEPLGGQGSVISPTTKEADESLPYHDLKEALAKIWAEVKKTHAGVQELLIGQAAERTHYSVAEVANLLNKDPYTVREWCRLGRIKAVRTHSGRGGYGEWRIAREEIQRYRDEGLLPDPRKK